MSVTTSRAVEQERDGMRTLISVAEAELLRSDADTPEHISWLAQGLLRRSPLRLWEILRAQEQADIAQLAEPAALLDALAQRLLDEGRIRETEALLESARRWHLRLTGRVDHGLAEAYARSGDTARAEERLRDLLKREPDNVAAVRLSYTLAKAGGRREQAHALLNRLVQVDPSLASATFAYKERARLGGSAGRPVRIAILSSYVVDPLIPFLDVECRGVGLSPSFHLGGFNQYSQEILSPSSALYSFDPEIVFLALALEDLFPDITRMPSVEALARGHDEILERLGALVRELRARSKALIVVHELALTDWSPNGILDNRQRNGLVGWVEALNRALTETLGSHEAYLLPLRQVVSRVGTREGAARKLRHMARMRFAETALRELARYSMRYVKPLKGLTRKCVVVDLDGTLWGSVVGEVGADGIQLGPTAPGVEFVEFQEALLNLTRRGILLAACSKNNPDDVLPVLRDHPSMVLREQHFSALRINWRNKADNLREIAEELNIGLDSLVFVDDNPIERELIRLVLPEVLTVELPRDPSQFRSILEDMSDFEVLALTQEDEMRAAEYQVARKRHALERASTSLDEYLHSLELRAEIGRAQPAQLPRLVQLFNKTNQFNTTTRRYQTGDVDGFMRSAAHHVYVLRAADRFGDHGLVGTAVVRATGDTWWIEAFLLSCRIMGLSVETALLERIVDDARSAGATRLIGEFVPTAKNSPAEDLYRRHGFRSMPGSAAAACWELDPGVHGVERPTWICVEASDA
jgi:FkbH-like protein